MAERHSKRRLVAAFVLGNVTAVLLMVLLVTAGARCSYSGSEEVVHETANILAGIVGMKEADAITVVGPRMSREACKRMHVNPDPSAHSAATDGGSRYYRSPYGGGLLVTSITKTGLVESTDVWMR